MNIIENTKEISVEEFEKLMSNDGFVSIGRLINYDTKILGYEPQVSSKIMKNEVGYIDIKRYSTIIRTRCILRGDVDV